MKKIELLAPAGDYNCFLAAMNAGADAVYLSGEKYGARAYAKNFTEEEIVKAIDFAHLFEKKVFLTVNTLLKDDELAELYDYMLPFYNAGLDGVIVQDMGVISYLTKAFPAMPVHASTQLAITGLEGVKLLEKLNVKRTVLARELSMKEISYINDNSDMELETFVHGSLCYSYSGKCLFSSLVGGRSGNRGRCAGSCRQPYNDKYLLSTKDICCLSIIPEMIEAGISSLKIEGRMKSPEYVAGVTSIYRKYIDIYYENITNSDTISIKNRFFEGKQFKEDFDILTKLYTRGGNSTGYYYRHNGKDMISVEDASYKSDKGEIKNRINDEYIGEIKKIPLSCLIRIAPNENISLLINNEFYYEGELASEALNRPLDKETVCKQITKTKDTEFEFTDITYDINDKAFVRVSELNQLRRDALFNYKEHLLNGFRRNKSSKLILIKAADSAVTKKTIDINCEINNLEQLNVVIKNRSVSGVYVPFRLIKETGDELINTIHVYGKKVYIKFQSVIRYNYLEKNRQLIINSVNSSDGVLADSYEVIDFLNTINYEGRIIGDIHIYCLNNEAYSLYKDLRVSTTTMPVELNKKELYRRNITNEEIIAYGYLPMMISAQCINNTLNGCDRKYREINLTDRKNAVFCAINDCETCQNIVYNNVPLSLHSESEFINKMNPSSLRLCFTVENENRINDVINIFSKIAVNDDTYKTLADEVFKQNSYTKGHLNRGVL